MRKFLLSTFVLALAVCMVVGCSKRQERWSEKERAELRGELDAYREMAYLDNLAEQEFDDFSYDVVDAVEVDYPVYTTFVEMPGKGDTLEVYVVSTIVEELRANAHNMRNIYPYPYLVEEGILPAGLNHQAQRAFYDCFSKKVKRYYPSTQAFFNAVIGDSSSQDALTDMQMQCAADLFDWGIEIDETVVFD